MAPTTTTEPLPIGRVEEAAAEEEVGLARDDDSDVESGGESFREVRKRVSRLSVEGGGGGMERAGGGVYKFAGGGVRDRRGSGGGGRTLPPPHAWLAVEETTRKSYGSDPEEQWMRVLQGGAYGGGGGGVAAAQRQVQRRSSFSVVRRERAAREAWLDRAWEMKRSWHERNGGAPDADTPVVVVVGKGPLSSSSPSSHAAGSVGGGGVAMDMEEVRACRDLGLELPSDCTVEIQCYGLSAASSPSHTNSGSCSSGAASPSAASYSLSSPGADDPMDVKARLKVWAQAVALASTTHLGS